MNADSPEALDDLDDDDDDSYLAVDLPDGRSLVVVDGVEDDDFDLLELAEDDSEQLVATSADFAALLEVMAGLVEPHVADFAIQEEDAEELIPAVTYREESVTYALVRFGVDRWLELVEEEEMLYDGETFASPVDYLRSLGQPPEGEAEAEPTD